MDNAGVEEGAGGDSTLRTSIDRRPTSNRVCREIHPAAPLGYAQKGQEKISPDPFEHKKIPATTYFPTESPLQYHRRGRA